MIRTLLVVLVALLSACEPRGSSAVRGTDPGSGLPVVALSDLPREAQRTFELIRQGGPFPYERDGVTFGNRERLLPQRARGTYREYTVPTPGERDRGARRLVCAPKLECYYTGDHYASFERVAP